MWTNENLVMFIRRNYQIHLLLLFLQKNKTKEVEVWGKKKNPEKL